MSPKKATLPRGMRDLLPNAARRRLAEHKHLKPNRLDHTWQEFSRPFPERMRVAHGWYEGAWRSRGHGTRPFALRVLLPERGNLRCSLRLAFWSGHSHGRYAGSTWYADNFWELDFSH